MSILPLFFGNFIGCQSLIVFNLKFYFLHTDVFMAQLLNIYPVLLILMSPAVNFVLHSLSLFVQFGLNPNSVIDLSLHLLLTYGILSLSIFVLLLLFLSLNLTSRLSSFLRPFHNSIFSLPLIVFLIILFIIIIIIYLV